MNHTILKIIPCVLILIFMNNTVKAQVGKQPGAFGFSDSTKAKNILKWQNLKNWHNYNKTELSLEYYNKNTNFDNNRYLPSNVMPKDPLKIDYRSGSYYVPTMVRDELNLIMNRPKGNAFVPVLGVAYIAAKMASKYIFIQDKLKITKENITNTIDEYIVLKLLWTNSPQTASQLYENPTVTEKYTMNELHQKLDNLIDNKLVKQKNLEDREMQYFPAVTKSEYKQLLQQANADSSTSESMKSRIQLLITN